MATTASARIALLCQRYVHRYYTRCLALIREGDEAGMSVPPFEPVEIRRRFPVAPHVLFDAWITSPVMRRWLFASDSGELVSIDVDPRVGGAFSIVERREEGEVEVDHFGTYIEVDRPGRLAFTLEVPWHFPGTTQVGVDIRPVPEGGEMFFRQTGVDPATTRDAWHRMFDQLDEAISASSA
ncbi:SRPBCC family protein [Streptomyces spiralis]|uniref:SRPBCC family protein n=1 Tax=Streptomyces spiralis TaxID=66376 RepID=UPI0033D74CDC